MSHDRTKPLTTSGQLISDIILITQKRIAPVLSMTTGEKVSHKWEAGIVRTIIVLPWQQTYVSQHRQNSCLRQFRQYLTGNLSFAHTCVPLRQTHNHGQTSGNVYMEVELAPLQGRTNSVFEEWFSQCERNRKPKSGFHKRRSGFQTPKGVTVSQGLHGVRLLVSYQQR